MKNLKLSLAFATLLFATPLRAQEVESEKNQGITGIVQSLSPDVPKTERDLGAALSPMKKGQFSPFTGVLISPLAISTLIAELRAKDEEIKIEVDKAKGELEANFTYEKKVLENQCVADKKILQADVQSRKEQVKSLNDALKLEVESRPNTAFWTVLGVAAGVLLTAAATTAVVAATN
jgi:hypothetical protein